MQVLAILTGQAPQLAARMFGNLASGIKPTKPEELGDCQQSSATQEKKSWAVREVALARHFHPSLVGDQRGRSSLRAMDDRRAASWLQSEFER